jgi:Flp pilus assembly protein protease CpaA
LILVPPVPVSRLVLLGLVAAAAVTAIATEPPLSSFAGGFAAGAGAVFVLSFLTHPRRGPGAGDGEAP